MRILRKVAFAIAAAGVLAASAAVAKDELATVLVTGSKVGAGTELKLEYLGDGKAVGVQVELEFEGVPVESISLSGCAAPKSGATLGTCRFRGNTLVFAKLNTDITPLKAATLAKISVPKHKGTLQVTPVRVVTSDARGVSSKGELILDMYGEVQAK